MVMHKLYVYTKFLYFKGLLKCCTFFMLTSFPPTCVLPPYRTIYIPSGGWIQ